MDTVKDVSIASYAHEDLIALDNTENLLWLAGIFNVPLALLS